MFQNGIQDAKSQDTPLGTSPPSRNTFVLRNVKHFTELRFIPTLVPSVTSYSSPWKAELTDVRVWSGTIQNIQFTTGNLSSL